MRFYLDGKSSTELEEGVNIRKKKVAVMSVFLDGPYFLLLETASRRHCAACVYSCSKLKR